MAEAFDTNHLFIKKLTGIVLDNVSNESFGVSKLANASGMSLYRLSRKLHSINGKTVNQFIREVRLQRAHEILQNEDLTAAETAYKVGFTSPTYFNKCFHKFYGYPPGKIIKDGINEQKVPHAAVRMWNDFKIFPLRTLMFAFKGILLIAFISIAAIFLLFSINQRSSRSDDFISSDGRISIAVMPFQNMTNDTLWDVWQDGIQDNLITFLSNSMEFKVRQKETVNNLLKGKGYTEYALITPSVASMISKKLDAGIFIYGSINRSVNTIRVNANLINSKTKEVFGSFQIDGSSEKILYIIDSLSAKIRNLFIITKLKKGTNDAYNETYLSSVNSPDAYRYFILGQTAFYKNNFPAAIEWFLEALKVDSTLYGAMGKIAFSYYNDNKFGIGKEWCARYYKNRDKLSATEKIWADYLNAICFGTFYDRIKCMEKLNEIDDQQPMVHFDIGDSYFEMFQYEKAIPEFEKTLDLFRKWKIKPYWGAFYYELGISYHKTGQFRKEAKLYRKAEMDFPDDPGLMDQRAWLELSLGDTITADKYIKKWISIKKNELWSDARIANYMAYIYSMANDILKEEKYYRQALSLEPENPVRMNNLGYFLIDKNLDLNEGIKLVEKALKIIPDNFSFMHCLGWGLYKQGKYPEALDLLQKSWNLRMQKSIYNYSHYLHLEEVKKIVSGRI